MKIGILKHTNSVFLTPIKFRYLILIDDKKTIELFSAIDYEAGTYVSDITDSTTNPATTYTGKIKILKKWELYNEIDLDGSVNYELLEKSMNRLPMTAEFFVDLIKAIKETRETQNKILSHLKK